jgi:hypothetical protein
MNLNQGGHWRRHGGSLVIDMDPSPHEWEVGGKSPPVAVALEPTRKELRALLKEMKAFKAALNPPIDDIQPFADALAAARKKALDAARRYAQAANAFSLPARASLADVRRATADFLEDMGAIREWAGLSTGATSFDDAFQAARNQSKAMSSRYAQAMGKP